MDQFAQARVEALEDKVIRLEKKLISLYEHLKLPFPDETTEKIKDFIRQGKKADAAIFYHREKKSTLTEANAFVEKVAKEMGA